jgi:hypothetical protein
MKKGFLNAALSVMLIATGCVSARAESGSASIEEKQKKDKVQIVVIEKKERDKSGGGESHKPRSADHRGK